ncbi:MAG: phosphoribosylformylglycinamidine cyclo-ligase, partial [Candidatus Omnitrophota bacterium]
MKKKATYKQAGVDIRKAEIFLKKIKGKESARRVKSFASLFALDNLLVKYKKPYLVSSCDGVGSKLKLAQKFSRHDTVGIDLVAMNVNDIVCLGAKPLFFLDYIACGKLDIKVLLDVIKGIKSGLRYAGCLLVGGETAEMPAMYKKDEYDLAGFCVGIVDKDRVVDGSNISKGDIIIGFESNGLHSNGFSLVRRVLSDKDTRKHIGQLLKPTRIYVNDILSLLSRFTSRDKAIKGIAHITGGAFYNKAIKILPAGLGMVIDKKSWQVPPIFKIIQDKGSVT